MRGIIWPGARRSAYGAVISGLFCLCAASAPGADWYVNAGAQGAGTGTSWGDAWTAPQGIVWSAVAPGDTIHISGGVTGFVYAGFTVGKSGTEQAPITVRASDAEGHDGRVRFQSSISFDNKQWVTLDGRSDPALTPESEADILANINMSVRNPGGDGVYATGPVGVRILGVEIHNCGSATGADGVGFNTYSALPDRAEIGWCHIHDNWQDGINVNRNAGLSYNEVFIHHNVIERNGDDGIQIEQGADIAFNILRDRRSDLGSGHADGIQAVGSYLSIRNNRIYDFNNSSVFIETTSPTAAHWRILNNVLYVDDMTPTSTRGIQLKAKGSNAGAKYELVEWSDVLVANNTVFNFYNYYAIFTSKDSATVTNVALANVRVLNNLVYNCFTTSLASAPMHFSAYVGSASDLVVDYNLVAGPNKKINYGGVLYASGEGMALATPYLRNASLLPVFRDVAARDFALANEDLAARDRGMDLSADFGIDIGGVARPRQAAWDIGAHESDLTGQIPAPPTNFRIVTEP